MKYRYIISSAFAQKLVFGQLFLLVTPQCMHQQFRLSCLSSICCWLQARIVPNATFSTDSFSVACWAQFTLQSRFTPLKPSRYSLIYQYAQTFEGQVIQHQSYIIFVASHSATVVPDRWGGSDFCGVACDCIQLVALRRKRRRKSASSRQKIRPCMHSCLCVRLYLFKNYELK